MWNETESNDIDKYKNKVLRLMTVDRSVRLIKGHFTNCEKFMDELTEWLRCCTRNAMVFRRGSSNLPLVDVFTPGTAHIV